MWAEHVSAETIDSRIWPRMAAVAERLWSPPNVSDVNSMYQRLDVISHWLDAYGLMHNTGYNLMLERIVGSDDTSPLRTLVDLVEPVKGYAREGLATTPPTQLTPLNRIVDAARPESLPARRFATLVEAFLAGPIKPGMESEIRTTLSEWRDNHEKLHPLAQHSAMVEEVEPLSESLSALGVAGLEALDYLDRGEKAPKDRAQQQLTMVEQAFQPRAQVLLMVAPAVGKLIQASAGEAPTNLPIPKSAQE